MDMPVKSHGGATKYYYGDGTEIVMNPGKTYVALVENTSEVTIKE